MLLIFFVICQIVFSDHDAPAPRHVLNLDLPPAERWTKIAPVFNESLHRAVEIFFEKPGMKLALKAMTPILDKEESIKKWFGEEQGEEILSLAKLTGIDVGILTLWNGLYDIVANNGTDGKACTSIVAQSTDGEIVHGRNLDFGLKEIMVNITLIADFQRNGTTLFSAVTFFGMTGFNTVIANNRFTMTHDERDQGNILKNIDDVFVKHRIFTLTYFREVAENAKSFSNAVDMMIDPKFSAPSYFIIGGLALGEGVVVTHDRDTNDDIWRIGDTDNWYVMETNYDHWGPVSNTDDRRTIIQTQLNNTGPDNMNKDSMLQIILDQNYDPNKGQRPIYNNGTVYSIVFQAAKPEDMKVIVHYDW